jgi:hypothetical protein
MVALRAAATAVGWRVVALSNWRPPETLRGDEVVLYGEPLFADVVTPALGLALIEPPADWLVSLPPALLRRRVRWMTLGEGLRGAFPAFVKPAEEKCFRAGVYASGVELHTATQLLPPSTPVLVADPVRWEVEYRCFVLDRCVMTLSPYLRAGEMVQADDGHWPAPEHELDEAARFAADALGNGALRVPPAFVMDVARIADQGWAVIEANAAWGSGIYGCDPVQVLAVLERASRTQETLAPDDRAWLRAQYEVE